MLLKRYPFSNRWAGVVGALVLLIVGGCLLSSRSRLARSAANASYTLGFDLAEPFRTPLAQSEVVIVYLDEISHKDLGQPFDRPWDRTIHARLLQRLQQAGAKAVVFDVLFTDAGPDPAADATLAQAIRDRLPVILGADYTQNPQPTGLAEVSHWSMFPPHPPFEEAAAGWGFVQLHSSADFIIREHLHGFPQDPFSSLTWAAAEFLNIEAARGPDSKTKERWINYYGRPGAIPHASYSHALDPGGVRDAFFKDKIVFVGARPIAGGFDERKDEFRSPYHAWRDEFFIFMPTVEIHAVCLLNLIRGDWLRRLPPLYDWLLLLLAAVGLGWGLPQCRPAAAFFWALAGVAVLLLIVLILLVQFHLWFPWIIIAGAMTPLALVGSFTHKSLEWRSQQHALQEARRRAEAQIREQASFLDKAQDAIIVQDLSGAIRYWNQSAERLYGWNAAEIVGRNVTQDYLNPPQPLLQEARDAALLTGEWTGELRQNTKAGEEIVVESRWTLVKDDRGQPQSLLLINTDVTGKKKLESKFLRMQRMESIGALAGGISHDLNNVLTPIIMAVELLRGNSLDENSEGLVKMIETSAKRGSDLVRQVLAFTQGRQEERSPIQLRHLIQETEKIVRETFPKSIRVRANFQNNLQLVLGDATQLHQVLLNLCVNARDAMPNGGEIAIEASDVDLEPGRFKHLPGAKSGRYVLMRITDTGTGIPPEIAEKIFEPFFTTKPHGKGTGLGLSTVLGIVQNHGGFLDIESRVGKGTSFLIFLPALASTSSTPAASSKRELSRGRGELILVVDDEEPIRAMAATSLNANGYRTLAAVDGMNAISTCLQHENIALAVIDMIMPGMDGPGAVRALRKLNPQLKFILTSGLPEHDRLAEQLGTSDFAFLAKPFPSEALLACVQQSLRKPGPLP